MHIKTFEKLRFDLNRQYWKVPTDSKLYPVALSIIGCEPGDRLYGFQYYTDFIFVSYDTDYGWSQMNMNRRDYYDNLGFKYMGLVNVPDHMVSAYKYNL